MVKIIFSDFDNTMLDYYSKDNYFDDYKIDILKRIRERGIKFCIVSGRSVSFFKRMPDLIKHVDYILGSNGSCIYDVTNDIYVNNCVIEEKSYESIIKYLESNGSSFILDCLDKRYSCGEWDDYNCLEYDKNIKYSCEQIIVKVSRSNFDSLFKYLETIDNIRVNNLDSFNDDYDIDINDKSVSKGNAVLWLCNYLEIDTDDVIVFGDGENDKSMFKVINKGVAVGNAIDKLKILSKDVTLNCEENGIYKYMEENILK